MEASGSSLFREITPSGFGEIGRPYLLRRAADGQRVAIGSTFDALSWPGRTIHDGQRLRHRLSLYSRELRDRLAVFDAARFPINDVAFHPSEPWVAIATGSYDGGYQFNGELLLWNVATSEYSNLLGESREVVRCRFTETGDLVILLRPRDEEEYSDPFDTYLAATIDMSVVHQRIANNEGADERLAGLAPIDPERVGFGTVDDLRSHGLSRVGLDELKQAGFEERHHVWDVAWLDDDLIGLVHDCCHLEVWHVSEGRKRVDRGAGRGIQLFHDRDRVIVHVLVGGVEQPARSELHALVGNHLVPWQTFDTPCTFSLDTSGRVLARDIGDMWRKRPRRDRVLAKSGLVLLETDLGHYDPSNHYVRIDGDDRLYFLRGTPPASHQGKRLCAIDANGSIREIMEWDDRGKHLMDGCAAMVDDDHLLRSYRIYDRWRTDKQIQLYSLSKGSAIWTTDVDADVIVLCIDANTSSALFALTNGQLGIIDLGSGTIVFREQVTVDGIASIATSIAVRGDTAVIGTIDGRLLLFQPGLRR